MKTNYVSPGLCRIITAYNRIRWTRREAIGGLNGPRRIMIFERNLVWKGFKVRSTTTVFGRTRSKGRRQRERESEKKERECEFYTIRVRTQFLSKRVDFHTYARVYIRPCLATVYIMYSRSCGTFATDILPSRAVKPSSFSACVLYI